MIADGTPVAEATVRSLLKGVANMNTLQSHDAIYGALEGPSWNTEFRAARESAETVSALPLRTPALARFVTREQMEVLETWFPRTAQTLLDVMARRPA